MTGESVHEGGCLCGAIRYRADCPPVRGVICHCSMCRRHSGATCLACGSTLAMHEDVLPDRVQATVGSLDDPNRVSMDDHVWTEDQVSWFEVKDELPKFRQNSAAVPFVTTEPRKV